MEHIKLFFGIVGMLTGVFAGVALMLGAVIAVFAGMIALTHIVWLAGIAAVLTFVMCIAAIVTIVEAFF